MTRVVWDAPGERRYETGTDRGMLYLPDGTAVPWNGLTGVENDMGDLTTTPLYIDGFKYYDAPAVGDFAATIKALTYPDEFSACEGIADTGIGLFLDNQMPLQFGMSYRTLVGNDTVGPDYAYKIHILYNMTATADNKQYNTRSESTTPEEFTWKITGTPQILEGYRPTAHLILDSRKMEVHLLERIEDILYGTATDAPRLPDIVEMYDLAVNGILISVTDNGDGTFTISGPDDLVYLTGDGTTWQVDGIDTTVVDANTYTASSTHY